MENKDQLLYVSSAYKKYKERYDKKPWLLVEDMFGIKLSLWQKLQLLILHKYEKLKTTIVVQLENFKIKRIYY